MTLKFIRNGLRRQRSRLPLMIGKVVSGGAAVIAVAMAVYPQHRSAGPGPWDQWYLWSAAAAGVIAFVLFSRRLQQVVKDDNRGPSEKNASPASSAVSWFLLVLFAAAVAALSFLARG